MMIPQKYVELVRDVTERTAGIVAAHEALQREKIALHRVDGWLCVPTEPAPCWIPIGMSGSDLQLVLDTINLWRSRLIKPEHAEPPID